MRFRLLQWLALGLIAAGSSPAQTDPDLEKALEALERSSEAFLELVGQVDAEQWDFRPRGMRHTFGEEAEHVALSEHDLRTVIEQAMAAPEFAERAAKLSGKEEQLHEFFLGEEQTAENYQASKKLINEDEVREYYDRAHRRLIELLESSKNLGKHIATHPHPDIGELTGVQWIYYIAYHRDRHIQQMKAILAAPDFPGRSRSAD